MFPMQLNRGRFSGLIALLISAGLLCGTSLADTAASLKLAPRGANAVMTIDLAKLMASPFGQSAGIQGKLMSGYADRPLAVSATAKSVTLVAGVHPMGMEAIWSVAIVELGNEPRLDAIVAAQGGFLDTIEGKTAGWTRRDTYYVQLDKQVMGVVRPGQRQFVSRWIAGKNEAPLSSYLTNAVSAGADADVVFAVDMDGVIGLPSVRYALRMGELPSLEKMEPKQQSALLAALATVKGMKITVHATDKLNAEWVIDFGANVAALGSQVEPFIIDVLTAANLYDGNADKWDFKAEGSHIVGKGTMELDRLTRLVGLLAPGDLSTDAAAAKAPAMPDTSGVKPPAGANDAATASLNYYRAIAKSLDRIGPKISPTQGAAWLNAQAKIIEQLPLLNVDPALLAWGNQVVEVYRRAGQELAMGQMNAQNAALGVASPTSEGTYDATGAGAGGDTAGDRAAFQNAQQQRRQVAQTERANAAGRALNYFNQIAPMRGQLRAEMTQKYGIEF